MQGGHLQPEARSSRSQAHPQFSLFPPAPSAYSSETADGATTGRSEQFLPRRRPPPPPPPPILDLDEARRRQEIRRRTREASRRLHAVVGVAEGGRGVGRRLSSEPVSPLTPAPIPLLQPLAAAPLAGGFDGPHRDYSRRSSEGEYSRASLSPEEVEVGKGKGKGKTSEEWARLYSLYQETHPAAEEEEEEEAEEDRQNLLGRRASARVETRARRVRRGAVSGAKGGGWDGGEEAMPLRKAQKGQTLEDGFGGWGWKELK